LDEVDAALERYRQSGIEPPKEWLNEKRDIEDRLLKHRPYAAAGTTRQGIAALAQPEPVAPTDEELDELAVFWWGSDIDERTVTDVIECCSMTAYARAALARWGTPANTINQNNY
jgi:hypothetical protein